MAPSGLSAGPSRQLQAGLQKPLSKIVVWRPPLGIDIPRAPTQVGFCCVNGQHMDSMAACCPVLNGRPAVVSEI